MSTVKKVLSNCPIFSRKKYISATISLRFWHGTRRSFGFATAFCLSGAKNSPGPGAPGCFAPRYTTVRLPWHPSFPLWKGSSPSLSPAMLGRRHKGGRNPLEQGKLLGCLETPAPTFSSAHFSAPSCSALSSPCREIFQPHVSPDKIKKKKIKSNQKTPVFSPPLPSFTL